MRNSNLKMVKKETDYYSEILNFKADFLKKKNRLHGYKIADKFDYFVTIDSTLGYECLARGKRVAFFNNRYFVSKFKNGNNHRFGWPKNNKVNGPFWTNSSSTRQMDRVLKRLFSMSVSEWSSLKKKYINDVISYDFKNQKLIQKLNIIYKS